MVTLALIGAGKWGQNYLRTVSQLNNCIIKYVCAKKQKTLDILPNRYIKTLSIDDLVKKKDIDGFIIATPGSTHFEIAKRLLSLGQNLLIEKPLTTNYNQALILQKIWQIKKTKVLVGYTYLYNPAYKTFKKLYKDIENIRSINFEGLNSSERKDVSVIWDWGPHPISMLIDLIKLPIKKVRAWGSIKSSNTKLYDTVYASLQFINGIKASIHISWQGSAKVRRLTVKGDNKKIEFDDTNTSKRKILIQIPNNLPEYPKYSPTPTLNYELLEFTAAIQSSKKITSDINLGAEVTRVLSVIEQSASSNGRLVKLD